MTGRTEGNETQEETERRGEKGGKVRDDYAKFLAWKNMAQDEKNKFVRELFGLDGKLIKCGFLDLVF